MTAAPPEILAVDQVVSRVAWLLVNAALSMPVNSTDTLRVAVLPDLAMPEMSIV